MKRESCLYEGRVRHRRFNPVVNRFQYRLFMMYLDLDELAELFKGRWLWSSDGVNIAYFRRRDHFGDPRVSMDRALRDLVESRLGERPEGPIRLLTHLRYFGHCFNPVSFFYCFDREGLQVETIVAEIHNTPWGEEHCYVLGEQLNEHPNPGWKRYQFSKKFHVSPYMEMEIWYDWRFKEPGRSINVHLNNMASFGKRFDATLTLNRREMTGPALCRALMLYPFMTMKVVAMIYWQALRLLMKGAQIHTHPEKRMKRERAPA